jgi:hypothetical protein
MSMKVLSAIFEIAGLIVKLMNLSGQMYSFIGIYFPIFCASAATLLISTERNSVRLVVP